MKEMENYSDKIKQLFSLAKDQPPLLGINEVETLLNQPQTIQKGRKINIYKIGGIMFLATSVIVLISLFSGNPVEEIDQTVELTNEIKEADNQIESIELNSKVSTDRSKSLEKKTENSTTFKEIPDSNRKIKEAITVSKEIKPENVIQKNQSYNSISENAVDTFIPYQLKLNSHIDGIKMIELEKNEYEMFGIYIKDKNLEFDDRENEYVKLYLIVANEFKLHITQKTTNRKIIYHAPFYESSPAMSPVGNKETRGKPVMISYITNDNKFYCYQLAYSGKLFDSNYVRHQKDIEAYINNNINTWIPIVIRRNDWNLTMPEDLIFWYIPNDPFFEKLPSRIKHDIKQEYQSLFLHKNSENSQVSKTCTYFEICKNNAFEINNVSLFPNPCDGILNIKFELSNDMKVSVGMYSVNGQLLFPVVNDFLYKKGEQELQIRFSETYSDGIYLLSFFTSDGRIRTERVLIKRK